jgi:hypothetical protein
VGCASEVRTAEDGGRPVHACVLEAEEDRKTAADASGQDERMPSAMAPILPVIQRIADDADGVEQATDHRQSQAQRAKGCNAIGSSTSRMSRPMPEYRITGTPPRLPPSVSATQVGGRFWPTPTSHPLPADVSLVSSYGRALPSDDGKKSLAATVLNAKGWPHPAAGCLAGQRPVRAGS